MKETDQFSPPLQLDVGGIGSATKFDTPTELVLWIDAELSWYNHIREASENRSNDDSLATRLFSSLASDVQNARNQVLDAIASKADQATFASLVSSYADDIRACRKIYSLSRIARFITELSKTDPIQAFRVAASYCRLNYQAGQTNSHTKWARAGAISEIVEEGLNETSPRLNEVIDELGLRWGQNFSKIEEIQKQHTENQRTTLNDIKARLTEVEELLSSFKQRSDSDLEDGKAKIEAVRLTYKTELALQAPTSYWREKQVAHRKVAAGWAVGFAVVAVLLGFFVADIWHITLQPYLDAIAKATASGKAKDLPQPSYGIYLPILGAAFLSVWVLRIISRQLLLHFGLISDAGERVAMVKTFLALMQMPEHVKEDDRILILSALFRPSNKSDDDAAPPNWFDLLMQRVKT